MFIAIGLPICAAAAPIPPSASAAHPKVEVYPGPGIDTYKSNLYTVEVDDQGTWRSSYTYEYSRVSLVPWHRKKRPSVSFTTFGTTGTATVRILKLAGPITTVSVSPQSKNINATISGGQATFRLKANDKAWVTVDGDDANPLFIFADAPRPPVPPGALYYGPGVVTVHHLKAASNQVIYLDGGAWVRGNFDLTGTTHVRIMGPGILSGDLWRSEDVKALATFADRQAYCMIRADWNRRNLATVSGITIVDSPFYNFWNVSNAYSVKVLSPWCSEVDGFGTVNHVDQSFAFVGDNVFTPIWAGLNEDSVTVTNSFAGNTNNSVFVGGFWGNSPYNHYAAFVDNIDIKTYGNPPGWGQPTPAVFQIWVDSPDRAKGYSNQTYQNIRIEGNLRQPMAQLKNMVYPWGGENVTVPPLGNSYNLTFRNVTLSGTQRGRSEIKGWDPDNRFHHVIISGLSINGVRINRANFTEYFDVNEYVSGLVVE